MLKMDTGHGRLSPQSFAPSAAVGREGRGDHIGLFIYAMKICICGRGIHTLWMSDQKLPGILARVGQKRVLFSWKFLVS